MKRGFPRPTTFIEETNEFYGNEWNNRVYPWPYTASDNYIGNTSSRAMQCAREKLCGMCGEDVVEDDVLLIINVEKKQGDFLWNESGPFHQKCLHMVLKHCPAIATAKFGRGRNRKYKYEVAIGNWEDVVSLIQLG